MKDKLNSLISRLSVRLLEIAETVYLRGNGWKEYRPGHWIPPAGYPKSSGDYPRNGWSRRHAVNSNRFATEPGWIGYSGPGWYFWDPSGHLQITGPFSTKAAAKQALSDYCEAMTV